MKTIHQLSESDIRALLAGKFDVPVVKVVISVMEHKKDGPIGFDGHSVSATVEVEAELGSVVRVEEEGFERI